MDESPRDDSAAILVGRLIRSYRNDVRINGKRLSQDGLLYLMVERGEEFAADLDRSSVSRWESGARLAPRGFLVAFGRSLNVPKPEMDRMLSLAGYESLGDEEGRAAMLAAAQSIESQVQSLQSEVRSLIDSASRPDPPVDAYGVARDALRRMAPPGVYALVVGFILNALGLDGTLALLTYVLVALAIVIGQAVLRWLKPNRVRSEHDHIVDLFFISLFFTTNASLLIGTLTKADHFGFYTFEAFRNTAMPFLATILAHLALSLAASVLFSVLWDAAVRFRGKRRRLLPRGLDNASSFTIGIRQYHGVHQSGSLDVLHGRIWDTLRRVHDHRGPQRTGNGAEKRGLCTQSCNCGYNASGFIRCCCNIGYLSGSWHSDYRL